MTEARAYVYVYVTPPPPHIVQYIQVFLPAKPPLREGLTREMMIHTAGVIHRAIKLTSPIRGFVKPVCLWLKSDLDQCIKHYTIGIFFSRVLFIFTLPYSLTCHSMLTLPPVVRGGRLIACIHTECCIWTFESNLIAFIMVIICHLAVGLHNYVFCFFFSFLSFSLLCFFFLGCIFMILSKKKIVVRVEAFKYIAATRNELQICRIRSFLQMFSRWKSCLVTCLGKLFSGQDGGINTVH